MWYLFLLIAIILIAFLLIWSDKSQTSTGKLRSLLAQKEWRKANIETFKILYFAAKTLRKDPSDRSVYLGTDEINKLPCSVLHEIDQLWIKSTNGHFGFSVQMHIYEDCKQETSVGLNFGVGNEFISVKSVDITFPNSCSDNSIRLLIEKLGWSTPTPANKYTRQTYENKSEFRFVEDFNYNLQAPRGHLPFLFCCSYDYYRNPDNPSYSFDRNENYVHIRQMARVWNRLKACGMNF